jgi:hypothetical protein
MLWENNAAHVYSSLENVRTHTSSSRSHKLARASALPVAKYLKVKAMRVMNKEQQSTIL